MKAQQTEAEAEANEQSHGKGIHATNDSAKTRTVAFCGDFGWVKEPSAGSFRKGFDQTVLHQIYPYTVCNTHLFSLPGTVIAKASYPIPCDWFVKYLNLLPAWLLFPVGFLPPSRKPCTSDAVCRDSRRKFSLVVSTRHTHLLPATYGRGT